MMRAAAVIAKIKNLFVLYRLPMVACLLLVLFALIIGWMMNKPNKNIVTAMNEMISLSDEIRRNYHNRPDYWGLSTESVLKSKIAPATMLKDNLLASPIGATVLVGSGIEGAVVMPGMRSFDIVFKNLSAKDCTDLATHPLSEEHKLGLLSILVKNKETETLFTWGGENPLPITRDKAKHICQNSSAIIWNFE